VVVTENRIAFDVTYDEYEYTIAVMPAPAGAPWWKGTWKADKETGHIEARLYRSADGGLVLAGRWKEQEDYYWFTELRPQPGAR
jgi:hypothetical protein